MIIRGESEVGRELTLAREAKRSYVQTFLSSAPGQTVLQDLMLFCQALVTTVGYDHQGRVDPNATLVAEGRRQVWNRIQQRLGLTTEELYSLCRGGRVQRSEDE